MDFLKLAKERKDQLVNLAKARVEAREIAKRAKAKIRPQLHIQEVLDAKGRKRIFADIKSCDPLGFPEYAEKLSNLQKRSGLLDAFVCEVGSIEGRQVICVELVPDILMGSMGTAVGEAVTRACEYATTHRLPLIIFSASGGARMQEGMFSLMQMAKTSAAIARHSAAGLLYISVLTHPTTGGVTASFASLGDVIIAEPKSLIGFAGPRVIEQTIGKKLPDGFQSAEFQLEHGFVDIIAERASLRLILCQILSLHPDNSRVTLANLENSEGETLKDRFLDAQPQEAQRLELQSPVPYQFATQSQETQSSEVRLLTPMQQVELARHPSRPRYDFLRNALFTDYIELHGDRHFGDDRALACGIANFCGLPVTIAGHVKGTDLQSNIACNFGMPQPEGYRKFLRLAKASEKFGRPLITFIDTPGAYPGAGAEERGQGEAIAKCLYTLSELTVPIIAVVAGEGGSGGALALGVADHVIMLEHAIYSVLSPEGFASILWKDAKRAAEASEVMQLTSSDLLAAGMVDEILEEPCGGAHLAPEKTVTVLRAAIATALDAVTALSSAELLQRRYERFRRF